MKRLLPLSLVQAPIRLHYGQPAQLDIVKDKNPVVVDRQGGNGIYELESRLDGAWGFLLRCVRP